MKILIITDVTMPGGVDTYTQQLVKIAIKEKCKIKALIDNGPGSDNIYHLLERILGDRCIRSHISKMNDKNIIRESVESVVCEFQPDLVHVICGSPVSALVIREYLIERKIKFLFTESLIDEKQVFDEDVRKRVVYIYRSASKIITVSKNNSEVIKNIYGFPCENIMSIDNGVEISSIKQRKGIPNSKIKFVSVARLCEQKGIDVLIRAVSLLQKDLLSKMEITIWGDGELKAEYVNMIHEYGLSKVIFLRGWNNNISQELCNYDVFILPSRYEGMPISLIEAMAAKLPCIATNVSGIPEILKNGRYGCLIESENHNALAQAITNSILDYKTFSIQSDFAYKHICEVHNCEKNMNKIVRLWKEILDEKGVSKIE